MKGHGVELTMIVQKFSDVLRIYFLSKQQIITF